MFLGKPSDCISIKVKGFLSTIRRVGALSRAEEGKLVELTTCHLRDKAATWIYRLEASGEVLETLHDLQKAMMKKFVPVHEGTRATTKLWAWKISSGKETRINDFIDLVELADASEKEANNYFFNNLPGKYRKKSIKEFPTGDFEKMDNVMFTTLRGS